MLLIGFVILSLQQLHCHSPDLLQHLNVFLGVKGLELDTGLEVEQSLWEITALFLLVTGFLIQARMLFDNLDNFKFIFLHI